MTEGDRETRMNRLQECIRLAEDEYDQMYEPRTHAHPAGHYSDAKDFFGEAIRIARELGLNEEAERLGKRLAHVKEVFRSQFEGSSYGSLAASAGPAAAPVGEQASAAELIRRNARMVIEICQKLTEFEFSYSADSVKWLDGYIERIRTERMDAEALENLQSVMGSYLGEAIIVAYGGEWARDESGWHVRFNEQNRAYPFSKVAKQFANGAEDSVFRFYSAIGPLLSGKS